MNQLPTVTKNLLIINVLCFFGAVVAQRYGISLNNVGGMHFFLSPDFNVAQLVSYMFLHANFEHIFFNMFAVWMFGRTLEMVWGPKRFLIYYMICGIGAGLVQELISAIEYFTLTSSMPAEAVETVLREGSSILQSGMNYVDSRMAELNIAVNRSTVGASGAVYGILLAFGMLFPNSQMYVFPIPFPIKAKFFVIGYAVIELVLGMSRTADGVAHFAHLGGMIFGFLLIMYWKKNRNNGQFHY
jgi:membrane associated rhomboid family serine protease